MTTASTEIVTVEKDGRQVFDRFYMCFESLRTTWRKYCRPLIGLDSAFLKWELKSEILEVVGRNTEIRIYPIAWAVARVKNKDSWDWFIKKLQTDLGLGSGTGFSFISDRQKVCLCFLRYNHFCVSLFTNLVLRFSGFKNCSCNNSSKCRT